MQTPFQSQMKKILISYFLICFLICFYLFFIIGKTYVQFLKLGILGFPIEFKHIVTLTNETKTILYFSIILKFNAVMYPFIIILQQREREKKNYYIYFMCKK